MAVGTHGRRRCATCGARLRIVREPRSDEVDVVADVRPEKAVASSSTPATAPPSVKIGTADSGELMAGLLDDHVDGGVGEEVAASTPSSSTAAMRVARSNRAWCAT